MASKELEKKWELMVGFDRCKNLNYDVAMLMENTERFCIANEIDFIDSVVLSMDILNAMEDLGAEIIIVDSDSVDIDGVEQPLVTITEDVFAVKSDTKIYYKHILNCPCCDEVSHSMLVV